MDKFDAVSDFLDMIHHSWTFEKMTFSERMILNDLFFSPRTVDAIKGDYRQRWAVCNAIYGAYLDGLGYCGIGWREIETVPLF